MTTRRKDIGFASLTVAGWLIAALCVWKSTPGIGWLDAGDFATAGFTFGVPHPTGFPLLTQLNHVAGLVQVGPWANRTTWLSAAATGAAVSLLIATLCAPRHRGLAMLLAVAALVGLPTLSVHARTTEVYALNLLLGALLVHLVHRSASDGVQPDLRRSMLLGITLGLGLSHHALFRLWALPIVFIHLGGLPTRTRGRALLLGTLGTFLGGLTNLYLQAAAARGGIHNWGDPSTLRGLVRVLSGSEIREAFAGEMGSLERLAEHAAEAVTQLGGLWACLLVVFLFLIALLRIRRAGAVIPVAAKVAGWMIAMEVAYGLLLNPMGLRDLQNLQWTALTAPLLALALVAQTDLPQRWQRTGIPAGVGLLAALLFSTGDDRTEALDTDWSSEDLAVITLGSAPAEAAIFPASDSLIATTLFLKTAGDARPDIYLLGRSQASRGASLRYLDARQPYSLLSADAALPDLADLRPRFAALLDAAKRGGHAVRWERVTRDLDLPSDTPVVACWPFAGWGDGADCGAIGTAPDPGKLDASFGEPARRLSGAEGAGYRNWLAEWHGAQGSEAAATGNWQRALPAFAGAAMLSESSSRYSNLAVALVNLGRQREGLHALESAWQHYPRSNAVCRNARAMAAMPSDMLRTWKRRCPDQPRE